MTLNKDQFASMIGASLSSAAEAQECDCPACTGVFSQKDRDHMKQTVVKVLGNPKGVAAMHMHGNDGKYLPFSVNAVSSFNLPKSVNMLVPVLPYEVAAIMMDRIIGLFEKGQIDKAQLHQGFEIPADMIEFSFPVRMYKTNFDSLTPVMKETISAIYEAAGLPIEDTWQLVLTDSNGKFPTDFGYDHHQMHWQVIYGDL